MNIKNIPVDCDNFHQLDEDGPYAVKNFVKKMEFSIQVPPFFPTKQACRLRAGLQGEGYSDGVDPYPFQGVFITLNWSVQDSPKQWMLGTSYFDINSKEWEHDASDSIAVPSNGIVTGVIECDPKDPEHETWLLTPSYGGTSFQTQCKIKGDPLGWMKLIMGGTGFYGDQSGGSCDGVPSGFKAIFTIRSLTLDDNTNLRIDQDDFWYTDAYGGCLSCGSPQLNSEKKGAVDLLIHKSEGL